MDLHHVFLLLRDIIYFFSIAIFHLLNFLFFSTNHKLKLFMYSLPTLIAVIEMGELTINIPEELKEEMEEFPEIEWQVVVRKLLKAQLDRMLELKAIVAKSEFTEKDVEELSEKVDESLARRFKESLRK